MLDSTHANDRRKAKGWVNRYVAVAAVVVCIVAVIPGAASVVLGALEVAMCYQIAKFFKHEWTPGEIGLTTGLVAAATLIGQSLAVEATLITGPFAFVLKPLIAAGIVSLLGHFVIKHFDDLRS
jgi:uncharacterized protein (DUF697 family)